MHLLGSQLWVPAEASQVSAALPPLLPPPPRCWAPPGTLSPLFCQVVAFASLCDPPSLFLVSLVESLHPHGEMVHHATTLPGPPQPRLTRQVSPGPLMWASPWPRSYFPCSWFRGGHAFCVLGSESSCCELPPVGLAFPPSSRCSYSGW